MIMGIRKCSKCGKMGHNSRTCRNLVSNCGQVLKLFGVEFTRVPSSDHRGFDKIKHIETTRGQRKKGIPWSEEEHRLFLVGLEKLGKGNWRGISRNFVTTRTSTQVASHAQKYFLRLKQAHKNKFSPTIFSMARRNEAQCCIYSKERPNNIPPSSMLPELVYNNCRLFNNSSTQNSPSLELSLAAPPPAPLVWERRPVVLWKKQYAVQNM